MHYIFLDTNIYLHFRDYEDIDWEKVTEQNGAYEFVLAPIVFSELDKHKYDKNQRLSRKAKEVVKKLDSAIEQGRLARFFVQFQLTNASEDVYLLNSLVRSDADDTLIASILHFKAGIQESDSITFVTNDIGPKRKAQARGIRSLVMDQSYLLNGEVDESERTIKNLQQELNELKNKIPKIEISFREGSNRLKIERKSFTAQKDIFISSKFKRMELLHRQVDPEAEDQNPYINPMILNHINKPTKNQKEQYNEELVAYYLEYREYLEKLYDFICTDNEILKIEIVLRNSGNVPAEDIDVRLFFPINLDFISKKDCPMKPEEPESPKLKRGFIDMFQPSKGIQMQSLILSAQTPIEERIEIEESINGFELKLKSYRLKQHTHWAFPTIHVRPTASFAWKGFPIKYEVIIANVPNLIDGQLNLVFS